MSVHLTELADADATTRFREDWLAMGKPLDMDGDCVHIVRTSDEPLVIIGDAITRMEPDALIATARKR